MVTIPGGTFLMGSETADAVPADDDGPVRRVEVAGFAIDTTTVTNTQFAKFVAATDYRTEAARFG